MPKWRNWQTRATQNRVGFPHVGSTPTFGTNLPFQWFQVFWSETIFVFPRPSKQSSLV